MTDQATEAQIAAFLGKYTPAIEKQLREVRARLRSRFPRGYEVVLDNYNALAFGISPTARAAHSFISIVGYPRWVTLFFLQGASLLDPDGLLEGHGARVRSIRLKDAAELDTPAVDALIAQAAGVHESALRAAPALQTIIQSVAAKQRARRPTANRKLRGRAAGEDAAGPA